MSDVTCDAFRELISARLDDELDFADETLLNAHLAECAACAAHADQAETLNRDLQLYAAAELAELPALRPSLGERIRSVSAQQIAVFVVGVILVVLNIDGLVESEVTDPHLIRHDAVFGTALGVAMLSVSWRPHRAIGLVPITSAIALLMAVVAIADLIAGQATMLAEAEHVVEFTGLVFLWLLSGGVVRLRRRAGTLLARGARSTVTEWRT